MKNLNDTTIRMQLVNRYLNAETTIEEEQMLRQYYAQTEEVLTPEENDVRLLIMSSVRFAGEFALSEEKADEFDRLMAKKPAKRVALYWIVSAAAAVIVAFFLSISKQTDETPSQPQIANATPKATGKATGRRVSGNVQALLGNEEIAEPQQQESVTEPQSIAVEPEQTIVERPTIKQPKRKTHRNNATITERQVNNMMYAANFTNEQVETYRLQPVGDATIVTKTRVNGTSASYIVCLSDDNEGLHVVPINIEM